MTKQELAECIDIYGTDIYSFCRHLTKNRQDADELYQDTWLVIVKRIDSVDAQKNIRNFCLSVALGQWQNRKRKFAWRRRIAPTQAYESEDGMEYLASEELTPEELVWEKERNEGVWKAVRKLPEKLRVVILLYYMEDLSLAQISEITGVPTGTVKSRLYQARKVLAKELEGFLE